MIPGYVDVQEIKRIARFIADIDPLIPYSLLFFHPDHRFDDLPITRREMAEGAKSAALAEGLERVRIGNKHLLR